MVHTPIENGSKCSLHRKTTPATSHGIDGLVLSPMATETWLHLLENTNYQSCDDNDVWGVDERERNKALAKGRARQITWCEWLLYPYSRSQYVRKKACKNKSKQRGTKGRTKNTHTQLLEEIPQLSSHDGQQKNTRESSGKGDSSAISYRFVILHCKSICMISC